MCDWLRPSGPFFIYIIMMRPHLFFDRHSTHHKKMKTTNKPQFRKNLHQGEIWRCSHSVTVEVVDSIYLFICSYTCSRPQISIAGGVKVLYMRENGHKVKTKFTITKNKRSAGQLHTKNARNAVLNMT